MNDITVLHTYRCRHLCFVDSTLFPLLNRYTWYRQDNGYITTCRNKKTVYLHNLVMGRNRVDHKNRNLLDNRLCNLRPATASQNQCNQAKHKGTSSKYKGVYRARFRRQWMARIQINYKTFYIGNFKSDVEAAKAYNVRALEAFGEFAVLNKV